MSLDFAETATPPVAAEPAGSADELLTRKEASDFLLTLGVKLKPSTLARLWSTGGNGPPCVHHRNRPRYPREVLRAWAAQQTTALRRSPRTVPQETADGRT